MEDKINIDTQDMLNSANETTTIIIDSNTGANSKNTLSGPMLDNMKYSFIQGIHDRNTNHYYILKQNQDTHEFNIYDSLGAIDSSSTDVGTPAVLTVAGYSIYHIGLNRYIDFIIFVYYKVDKLYIEIAQVINRSLKFIKYVYSDIKNLKSNDILRAGTFIMNSTNYLYIYESRMSPCLHFIDLSTFNIREFVLDPKTTYNIASDGAPVFCYREYAYYGLRPMRKIKVGENAPHKFTICAPFIVGCAMYLYSRDESYTYINGAPAPNDITETIYEFGNKSAIITQTGPNTLITFNIELTELKMAKFEYKSEINDIICMSSYKMMVLADGTIHRL